MTRARVRALFLLLIVIIGAGLFAVGAIGRRDREFPARPESNRPELLLLTGLPLLFSEDFSLKGAGSPVLQRLQSRYRVNPISVTDRRELSTGQMLLMAQPRAQTAENLVALDAWVSKGGRLLLLADPLLEWPSAQPLSDVTRPPPMFMDTGLLAHWGIRLDAPDRRGPTLRELGHYTIVSVSPGSLHGRCRISRDRLVAQCAIGKGRATIIADADFLNAAGLGRPARHNLVALLEELASLEQS